MVFLYLCVMDQMRCLEGGVEFYIPPALSGMGGGLWSPSGREGRLLLLNTCRCPRGQLWEHKEGVDCRAGGTLGVLTGQGTGTDSNRGSWTPREDLASSGGETCDWGWQCCMHKSALHEVGGGSDLILELKTAFTLPVFQ